MGYSIGEGFPTEPTLHIAFVGKGLDPFRKHNQTERRKTVPYNSIIGGVRKPIRTTLSWSILPVTGRINTFKERL